MVIARVNERRAGENEHQDGRDLDEDHDVVGLGGLAHAAHQNDGEQHDDKEGGDVKAEVPSGLVEVVAGEVL